MLHQKVPELSHRRELLKGHKVHRSTIVSATVLPFEGGRPVYDDMGPGAPWNGQGLEET